MKFICLGYMDATKWDQMSEIECKKLMQACLAYDDELRRGKYFLGGEALQNIHNVVTLRYQNGKVTFTDDPYTETKEQLGSLLFLEARDLNHAIQLMSQHPGIRSGAFEIRPIDVFINARLTNPKT
ncbi:MAG: YciI family protein [Leptolyngbyaceae cyanobacterium CSU_1_3]|nr:YciI family protein [Leptolyngbyaceae cyanobacterium CSU_1_3]